MLSIQVGELLPRPKTNSHFASENRPIAPKGSRIVSLCQQFSGRVCCLLKFIGLSPQPLEDSQRRVGACADVATRCNGTAGMWLPKREILTMTRWCFQIFFMFTSDLMRWSKLTNVFQMGWNYQLVDKSACFLSFFSRKYDCNWSRWLIAKYDDIHVIYSWYTMMFSIAGLSFWLKIC